MRVAIFTVLFLRCCRRLRRDWW
uniref:Uncharacterized protein n=1 Tax=Anguilla anguilla TaxID=7936 RepID=A0A0E9S4D1_ANGAN